MSYKSEYESSRIQGARRHVEVDMDHLHEEWLPVFDRFNPDKNGEVNLREMRRLLAVLGETHRLMPEDAIDEILARADKDANGKLSYLEFLDLIIGFDVDKRQRPIVRQTLRAAAFTVVPRNERTYLSQYSCKPPPFFMILISLIEIGVFIYHSTSRIEKVGWLGINGVPFDSVLIYNPHKRYEVWRFVTYMFVHAGFTHIIFNILIQLLLGIPLEMVHKWWRVMIVYFAGVIAGSLGTSIADPKVYLCGASGGVYALTFAHLASVVLNWKEMEFAWMRLSFFLIFTLSDVGVAIYERYIQQKETKIGYISHLAGAIAGVLVGINVLRNLRKRKWEIAVWWISLSLYILLMVAAIVWNIVDPDNHFPPPR